MNLALFGIHIVASHIPNLVTICTVSDTDVGSVATQQYFSIDNAPTDRVDNPATVQPGVENSPTYLNFAVVAGNALVDVLHWNAAQPLARAATNMPTKMRVKGFILFSLSDSK
jgi:hypothetical protein